MAESSPMVMNLTSSVATSSSSVDSPIALRSLGILKASSRQVGLSGRPDASASQNSNPDPASSSQGWERDAQLFISTEKLVATGKDQKSLNRQEESVISTKKPVATEHQGCSGKPRNFTKLRRFKTHESNLATSFPYVTRLCTSQGESLLDRKKDLCSENQEDNLKDLDVKPAVWSMFMSVTLQAAVHLGRDGSLNLRSVKNQSSKSVDHLFRTTEKLIKEQTEITGLSTIYWDQLLWRESSLLCDRAVRMMKSQNYIFSDSVPCVGGISPEPVQASKDKIQWCLETRYLKELDQIDGETD